MAKKKVEIERSIEWAFWANQMCMYGTITLMMTSLIAFHDVFLDPSGLLGAAKEDVNYDVTGQLLRVWALVGSIIIFLIEYPRSKRNYSRRGGRVKQRPMQWVMVHFVNSTVIFRYYLVRFITYLVISMPCFFLFPTCASAILISIGSCVYLLAAFKKEVWMPMFRVKADTSVVIKNLAPPTAAPPRRVADSNA